MVARTVCCFPEPLSVAFHILKLRLCLDIYIACVSSAHNVCPKGYWVAIVSTLAESDANHHLELQPGLERLGKIEEQFMVGYPSDESSGVGRTRRKTIAAIQELTSQSLQGPPIPIYEPTDDGTSDSVFVSKSYDASSHFETTTDDVKDIYRRATGQELVVEGLREGIQVADEQ